MNQYRFDAGCTAVGINNSTRLKNCYFLLECTRDKFMELHCTAVEIQPPYSQKINVLLCYKVPIVQLQRRIDTQETTLLLCGCWSYYVRFSNDN